MLAGHRLDQRLRAGLRERAVGSHDGERERRAVSDVSGLVGEEDRLDAVTFPELVSDSGTHLLVDAWSSDARAPVRQELVQIRLELEAVAPLLAVEVVASVAEGFEALVDVGEVHPGLADSQAHLGDGSLGPLLSAVRLEEDRRRDLTMEPRLPDGVLASLSSRSAWARDGLRRRW